MFFFVHMFNKKQNNVCNVVFVYFHNLQNQSTKQNIPCRKYVSCMKTINDYFDRQ